MIWSERATPGGRSWWVLTTLARPTNASACGSSAGDDCENPNWQTPTATDATGRQYQYDNRTDKDGDKTRMKSLMLTGQVREAKAKRENWATPVKADAERGSGNYPRGNPTLLGQVRKENWTTPCADDASARSTKYAQGGTAPSAQVRAESGPPDPASDSTNGNRRDWPTPQAHDAKTGQAERVGRSGTEHGGRNLNDEVVAEEMWPTPTADHRSGLQSHGDNAILGQLNPEWVLQLMGMPRDWLDGVEIPPKPKRRKPGAKLLAKLKRNRALVFARYADDDAKSKRSARSATGASPKSPRSSSAP